MSTASPHDMALAVLYLSSSEYRQRDLSDPLMRSILVVLGSEILDLRFQRGDLADALATAIGCIENVAAVFPAGPQPETLQRWRELLGSEDFGLCSVCRSHHGSEVRHECE